MNRIRTIIKTVLIIFVSTVVVGYSAFELRAYAEGPFVEIIAPKNGETVQNSLTYVTGNTRNITFLYLNGRQIYTDETGIFKEYVLFGKGYNVVTVRAVGRFNKEIEKSISIIAP